MTSKDLFNTALILDPYIEYKSKEVDALVEAATSISKSWSGSWLGYHSRIYYQNFQTPPPGAAFSQEWGFMNSFNMGSRGDWREYGFEDVVSLIYQKAGNPSIDEALALAQKAEEAFDDAKTSVLSVVHARYDLDKDKFLAGLVEKIEHSRILDASDFIAYVMPKGQIISRDMIAIEKGSLTPPHMHVLAQTHAATFPFHACRDLKKLIIKLASHIKNLEGNAAREERIGTNTEVSPQITPIPKS